MQSVIAFATVLTQNQTIKGLNLNRPILYGEQVCILREQLICCMLIKWRYYLRVMSRFMNALYFYNCELLFTNENLNGKFLILVSFINMVLYVAYLNKYAVFCSYELIRSG